jgi:uncharacterized Zn finger protein
MVKELGDIDGVQYWACDACGVVAPALKRNKAPDVQHAGDCGKLKAAPVETEEEKTAPVVHQLDTLKSPEGSSDQ